MRAVGTPGRSGSGRWIWGLSGVVTAAVLAGGGTALIAQPAHLLGAASVPQITVHRSLTVAQPVAGLTVDSYGAPVRVEAGSASGVQVTETIMYDQGTRPPTATETVSGGQLTLAGSACANAGCSISFGVITPPGVRVTVFSGGGPIRLSGIAVADLDSGGGPVHATQAGSLTVSTAGGPLLLDGVTGPLNAQAGDGNVMARDITAGTVSITTNGGPAHVEFASAPERVTASTGGGALLLAVPGGPYALTANSGGGPESIAIPTDSAAVPSISANSGGGPLEIHAAVSGKSLPVGIPPAKGGFKVPPAPPAPPEP